MIPRRAAANAASLFFLIALAILFALTLVGCRPICMNTRKDLRVVGTPAAGADVVLQVAKEKAPCQPKKLTGDLPFPAGTLTWREAPWNDGVGLVAGTSNAYSCDLEIDVLRLEPAPKSALAHEVAHWFWQWCYEKTGEVTQKMPDGQVRRVPDADLVQWFNEVNTEATRRMMNP